MRWPGEPKPHTIPRRVGLSGIGCFRCFSFGFATRKKKLVARGGVEPPSTGSKPAVLTVTPPGSGFGKDHRTMWPARWQVESAFRAHVSSRQWKTGLEWGGGAIPTSSTPPARARPAPPQPRRRAHGRGRAARRRSRVPRPPSGRWGWGSPSWRGVHACGRTDPPHPPERQTNPASAPRPHQSR